MKSQMKTLLLSLVGGVALMGAASAQATTVNYGGHLTLRAGTAEPASNLECFVNLTGNYTIVPGGPNTVSVTNIGVASDSSSACQALVFSTYPYPGTDYRGPSNDNAVGDLSISGLSISVANGDGTKTQLCPPGSGTASLSGILTPEDPSSGPAPAGYPDHIIFSELPIPDNNPDMSNCVIDGTLTYQ